MFFSSFRFLPGQSRDQFFRISSDPLLSVRPTNALPEDDRGVHGGEYAVRPNMQGKTFLQIPRFSSVEYLTYFFPLSQSLLTS